MTKYQKYVIIIYIITYGGAVFIQNPLEKFKPEIIQKIFECLSQAIGEDSQEAKFYLNLIPNMAVSAPFLNWDLFYRNLIKTFDDENVIYSVTRRGMWVVLLLYDIESGLVFSFMKDIRFNTIKRSKNKKIPKYIRSLINLNSELESQNKQLTFLSDSKDQDDCDKSELIKILNDLCSNFVDSIDYALSRHVIITFSDLYGRISSLNAYVLDNDLDIVYEQDLLNVVKPVMSNGIDIVDVNQDEFSLKLKPRSLQRKEDKKLVALKEQENQKQA